MRNLSRLTWYAQQPFVPSLIIYGPFQRNWISTDKKIHNGGNTQEAAKKKSLQILENNVAEGADDFKLRFFPNHIRTSKRERRASVQRQRC